MKCRFHLMLILGINRANYFYICFMQFINVSKISGDAVDSATKCLGAGVSSLAPIVPVPITLDCSQPGWLEEHRDALADGTEHPLKGVRAEKDVGHHQCPGPVCLWWSVRSTWCGQAVRSRCRVGRCSLLGVKIKSPTAAE